MKNALSFFEPWPPHLGRAVSCDARGLVIGAGTRLVRMTDKGRLAVEPDAARCIALLSILAGRPVGEQVLRPIEADQDCPTPLHDWVSLLGGSVIRRTQKTCC